MANTKSAKKQAKKNVARGKINLARRTAIKTAIKKVLVSVQTSGSQVDAQKLLSDVAAKLARARGKGVIHANTASRKLSRLAKKS